MCVLYKNAPPPQKKRKKEKNINKKKNGDEYSITIANHNYFIGYLDYFTIKFLKWPSSNWSVVYPVVFYHLLYTVYMQRSREDVRDVCVYTF